MYAGMSGLSLSAYAQTFFAYRTMFWSVSSSAYSAKRKMGSFRATGD